MMALGVGIGIGVAVGGLYIWWNTEGPAPVPQNVVNTETTVTNNATPAAAKTSELTPSITARTTADKSQSPALLETADSPTAPLPQDNFVFAVVHGEKILGFTTSLDDAIKVLKDNKNAELKIFFPTNLLNDITELHFRRWLARVGDYIFVQRIMMTELKDMTAILQDPVHARVGEQEIERRGNILLTKESHLWSVQIRGLEGNIEQVKFVVNDILLKGLRDPESIADPLPLEPRALGIFLRDVHNYELYEDHEDFINALVDNAVFKENLFGMFNIEENLAACLPSLKFENLSSNSHYKDIQNATEKFIKNVYLDNIKKTLEYITDFTEQDFHQFTIVNQPKLMEGIKSWVAESNISQALLGTLYN